MPKTTQLLDPELEGERSRIVLGLVVASETFGRVKTWGNLKESGCGFKSSWQQQLSQVRSMCSKLICKRAQLCTVCSPNADPVVMVSFVHQPSESVRKWRGGRGKGEDPGYCIHQHYLRRAYCMPSTL